MLCWRPRSVAKGGGPGYSALPHMQRVISSVSASFSSASLGLFEVSSFSLVLLRLLRRVAGGSPRPGCSESSRDSDLWVPESWGETGLLFDRVFLSARVREFKDVDEFVCVGGGGGWVVRAREDLRGVMVLGELFSRQCGSVVVMTASSHRFVIERGRFSSVKG